MTTIKSDAVNAGLMPDYSRAGVVLCRHVKFTTADDSLVSGDTVQMLPVPSGARILELVIQHAVVDTGQDVGYGGDPNAFADTDDWSGTGVYSMVAAGVLAGTFLLMTHDDTIDWAVQNTTKVVTGTIISMTVYYNMIGSIKDDTSG